MNGLFLRLNNCNLSDNYSLHLSKDVTGGYPFEDFEKRRNTEMLEVQRMEAAEKRRSDEMERRMQQANFRLPYLSPIPREK